MEILALLFDGIAACFEPLNLALIFIGVTVGLFIGAMPGLGSVNGVTSTPTECSCCSGWAEG